MKNTIAVSMILSALALAACDKQPDTSTTRSNPPPANTNTTPPSPPPAPDNTANNKRDTDTNAKTPLDQANNRTDVEITANIRRAIMEDKAMSVNAQNVKIITEAGVVTLRGVVDTAAEKTSIETKAKAAAGVTRVDNQLEVKGA